MLPDRVDSLVRQWAAAALRALVSRTRATLEHPKADAEANRLELLLRAEPRAQVALADRLAEVEHRRGETMTELTSLMVVAREQTDEDRRELARLEQEVQRLDLERELLAGLQKRLGPNPRWQAVEKASVAWMERNEIRGTRKPRFRFPCAALLSSSVSTAVRQNRSNDHYRVAAGGKRSVVRHESQRL